MGITRSKRDRWILGVCGGIAYTYGWDPKWVRIAAILLTIFLPGPGWILPVAYLLLGAILPESEAF